MGGLLTLGPVLPLPGGIAIHLPPVIIMTLVMRNNLQDPELLGHLPHVFPNSKAFNSHKANLR